MTHSPETKGGAVIVDNATINEAADASTAGTDDDNYDNIVYRNSGDRPVHKLSVQLIDTYKHINKVT